MGNECTKLCLQNKNQSEIPLPNKNQKLNIEKKYDAIQIFKIINIQRFYKTLQFRNKIKIRLNNLKKEKRKLIKEQTCKFKEKWETHFLNKSKEEFSINGLNKIKKEIFDIYDDFFRDYLNNKSSNIISNWTKDKNILISEQTISIIKTKSNFINDFRIPILKIMTQGFLMGDLNHDFDKIKIELQNVELKSQKYIEEMKTLENGDEDKIKEVIQGDKQIEIENIFQFTNNDVDLFYLGKSRTSFSKQNNKICINEEWLRKDTNKSDISVISNTKTNCKTTTCNMSSAITNDRKQNISNSQEINFRKLICDNKNNPVTDYVSSLSSQTKFNTYSIEIKKSKFDKHKILLFSTDSEFDLNKYSKINLKINTSSKTNCKFEFENIINKITEEKDKDCKYINYMDSNNVFYQGSWHIKKVCKLGLGYAYMVDNTKGKRYKYYGYFKDDVFNGIGMLLYENGYSYFGEFRNGKKEGYGNETQENITYKGFFRNGSYNGYGEYICKNKISYAGTFLNGLKHEYGILYTGDGSHYCGTFKNDKMHGIGFFKWAKGDQYYGHWKNDKMNGVGHYKYAKGDRYIGYYENDLRHGYGEYYFKNGAILYGLWRLSKKEGKFELHENGLKYFINYRNDTQIN